MRLNRDDISLADNRKRSLIAQWRPPNPPHIGRRVLAAAAEEAVRDLLQTGDQAAGIPFAAARPENAAHTNFDEGNRSCVPWVRARSMAGFLRELRRSMLTAMMIAHGRSCDECARELAR